MNHSAHRRRAVVLALLVMILAVLAAIFAVLSTLTIQVHNQHRADGLDRTARSAADSLVLLVQRDLTGWSARLAEGPVDVAIDGLISPPTIATAQVTLVETQADRSIHIAVNVSRARQTGQCVRELATP